MRTGPILPLLAWLFLAFGAESETLVLNVGTNGNDEWSGSLPQPTANRDDGPLATVHAALKTVLTAQRLLPEALDGATILIRGGTYELEEPIELVPGHSGPNARRPLLIAAYPGEKPIISGGRRITGWKPVEGKQGMWQAEVPEVREGKWYFRQLFVNGKRRQRARTPNEGYYRIQGESPQDKPVKIKFKPGEIKKEWAENGDVELVALLAWAELRMQIRSVDESNHVATLSGNPRPSNKENNAKYYIENAPDALDKPGEWYLDRRTGIVRYFAEPGEKPDEAVIIAPRLTELVRLKGDFESGKPVQHIVIRGITFSYTDWELASDGYADTQAAVGIRGDILGEGVQNCLIEDCVFTHLGGYAVEFGRGCKHVRIVGNEMFDLGAGGVRLGEPTRRESEFDQTENNVVTDNHIYQLGIVYPAAVGVLVFHSGHNRIAHNHIHDLFYTAISVGWTWGYNENPCYDNLIEFNHLHDIGKGVLSDMGAIYTLGPQKGTVIRNNLIHDVNAFTYGGWGLYTDEGSSFIRLESNVVYRCKSAGFHQHYGRENVLQNNIFALNSEHQLMRTREEDHISFIFKKNIVYFDSGDLLGGNWSNDKFVMDENIYFDARPEAYPETLRFAGATLEEWRKHGHDLKSVILDPLFVYPKQYNFRLSSDSPALKLGFRQIDVSRVGVRDKTAR